MSNQENKRISFNYYDALHLYELSYEHFQSMCAPCEHLQERLEKFLTKEAVSGVESLLKKSPYCLKCKDILKNYPSSCNNGVPSNLQEAKKKLDDLYSNLIDIINEKQNTILNINIKNVDEIQDAYSEYQELQNNMNEHYTDTVLIDNKNNILNSKLNSSSSSIKLYAFAIVLLVCANIAFYIKFLKNN